MSLSTNRGGYSNVSSGTACAACKFQRKRCTKKCLLAPYFPQNLQNQFLNAHRLFGVSNITKMIKGIEESQRDTAMRNLILHANARAKDPVGGLYRIMCDLTRRIECCRAELNLLHQQLAFYRSQAQQQTQSQHLPFGCYSHLLQQGEEHLNDVNDYNHMNVQQQQHEPSLLDYEMFFKMSEQTGKVKLEKEGISNEEQTNLLGQILM